MSPCSLLSLRSWSPRWPSLRSLAPPLVALALTGCVNSVVDTAPAPTLNDKEGATRGEAWTSSDSPTLFSSTLSYRLADLPQSGEAARIPWAGSYWPVAADGINARWDGPDSESAAAKYGRAFGVGGVEDAVSRANGVDSQAFRTKCTAANAATTCDAARGEQCAVRAGRTEGVCIPSWFGICHAWAPAAILVPEPKHAVTRNGVTFKVNDLKALGSLVHEGVDSRFVSLRCELDDGNADEAHDVDFDAQGRPTDRACRDSNAGSFHVLLTNYLGLQRASFVFDRTYDDEVWNQPLRGYDVRETRAVSIAEANRLLGVTTSTTRYRFNTAAKGLQYVKIDVHYVSESDAALDGNLQAQIDRYTETDRYEYVLELDVDGRIIGGEWVGESKRLHPDFAWLPTTVTQPTVAGGKIRYADVKSLLDESLVEAPSPSPSPTPQAGTVRAGDWRSFGPFDVAAGATFTVAMTGTGDADLYVRRGSAPSTASFDCRPYADNSTETCTVPGGGPVFVSVNGYAASSSFTLTFRVATGGAPPSPPAPPAPPSPSPAPAPAHLDVSGSVALGAFAYHEVDVVAGRAIVVRTTAPADVDVYLRLGADPTTTAAVARVETDSGDEELRFVPSSSGRLHIGIYGYNASTYRLVTADQ